MRSSDTLEIKVVAKTTGWVGWGLSPNGGMVGCVTRHTVCGFLF
jgi:hypothetical protein